MIAHAGCSKSPQLGKQNVLHELVLQRPHREHARTANRYLPAVAVGCTDVGAAADQEVHHAVMSEADGVVEGSDALFVRLAGVTHLRETEMFHCISYFIHHDCQQFFLYPPLPSPPPRSKKEVGAIVLTWSFRAAEQWAAHSANLPPKLNNIFSVLHV